MKENTTKIILILAALLLCFTLKSSDTYSLEEIATEEVPAITNTENSNVFFTGDNIDKINKEGYIKYEGSTDKIEILSRPLGGPEMDAFYDKCGFDNNNGHRCEINGIVYHYDNNIAICWGIVYYDEEEKSKIGGPITIQSHINGCPVVGIVPEAFSGLEALTGQLVIPDTVKYIGECAFIGCTGFEGDLIIPDSVLEIGEGAFGGIRSPGHGGRLVLGDNITSIGPYAFEVAEITGSVHIPKNLKEIGYRMFSGNEGITGELVIPDGVEEIGEAAFGYTGFNSVKFPSSLKRIEDNAFYHCSNLAGDFTIPASIEYIGYNTFGETGLDGTLMISAGAKGINRDAFNNCKFIKIINNGGQFVNTDGGRYDDVTSEMDLCRFYGDSNWPENKVYNMYHEETGEWHPNKLELGTYTWVKDYVPIQKINMPENTWDNKLKLKVGDVVTLMTYEPSNVTIKPRLDPTDNKDSYGNPCLEMISEGVFKAIKPGKVWISYTGYGNCTGGMTSTIYKNCAIEIEDPAMSNPDPIEGPTIKDPVKVSNIDIYSNYFTWFRDNTTTTGSAVVVGDTNEFSGRVSPSDADNQKLSWTSSDPDIISIVSTPSEGNVVIKGKKAGKAKLTAKATDGSGIQKSITIASIKESEIVKINVQGVYIDYPSLVIDEGKTANLKAVVYPEDATFKSVKWKSSNKNVVTVSQKGVIKGVKAGEAVITVTTDQGGETAEISIKVQEGDEQDDPEPLPKGKKDISKATISGIKNTTYTGKAKKPVPTVVYDGKTLKENKDYTLSYEDNVNAGTARVVVTGKGKYARSTKVTFKINKAKNTLAVSTKKTNIKYSKLKKQKKTISASKVFKIKESIGEVTYKKKSGNKKITVSKSGKITIKKGLKKGTYKIKVKVTAAGDKNHKAGTKAVTLTIYVK